MRIMLVAGARPNFMKIAPVLATLDHHSADTIVVHTGQHYDPLMSDVFLDELGIRKPDHHLEAGSGTHAEQTAAATSWSIRCSPTWNAPAGVPCSTTSGSTPTDTAW